MMLIWYKTNLGVGNTMVPSEIAKYIIIKVLLAIEGSWRWGPYLFIGPDRGQHFAHCLGVKWYLSFSRDVSHYIEFVRMYVIRQYRGMSIR